MTENSILQALTREGVLINVSVRFWRASKKLEPGDLGLDAAALDERLISLGRKRLLPKDALAQFALIESRAHAMVEQSTFPFLGGIAHFLPNRKLSEIRQGLDSLRDDFETARAKFKDCYADLRENAIEEWRELARELSLDARAVIAKIEASYPEPDALDRYFGFEVRLYQVRAPESLEAECITFADQEHIVEARKRAAADAAAQMGRESESFVAECVATLRQEASKVCEDMLSSIQTGKTDGVHQKTLNRLLKFIDDFKALNFAGDAEFDRILENARTTLLSKTAEEYRDNAAALTRLQSGLKGLAQTAKTLAQQDAHAIVSRFGQMGTRKFTLAA
jgi:hypothetical protein